MSGEGPGQPPGKGRQKADGAAIDLARIVADHDDELAKLRKQLTGLMNLIAPAGDQDEPEAQEDEGPLGDPFLPVNWADLDDEGRQLARVRLYEWLRDDFIPEQWPYANELPLCWYRHAYACVELELARALWVAAYRHPERRKEWAAEFRDRWWPGIVRRLEKRVQCKPEMHQDLGAAEAGHPVIDDEYAFAERAGGVVPELPAWVVAARRRT